MSEETLLISPDVVGNKTKPLEVEITRRMIMNYAAGIDDHNPWHFADDRTEGIVAAPMMAWALTWQFSVQGERLWGDNGTPKEIGPRGVHFTEEMEFSRPIVPGDKLTITGETVDLRAHRAGTYIQTRYTGIDANGEHVFTQHTGGMLRDVRCSGDIEDYQPRGIGSSVSDQPIRTLKIPIHAMAAHIYDGCADIHNPIHTSRAFALGVGLPDIILHGTATLAYAIKDITNTEGKGDPRAVKSLYASFTSMVFMPSEVELQVLGFEESDDTNSVYFQVIAADGKKAVRDGCITFKKT